MTTNDNGRKLTFNSELNKIINGLSKVYAIGKDGLKTSDFYALQQFYNICTYFAGEFDELTNNKQFKRIKLDFWRCALESNEVYIYANKELNKMVVLSKVTDNKFKVYNSAKFYDVDESKLARFEFPIMNAWLQWYTLFLDERYLVNIWALNALSDARKVNAFINTDDPVQLEKMIEEYYDPTMPFIINRTLLDSTANGIPNNLQPWQTGTSTTGIAFDNIVDHFNLYADRLGYAIARELKKERLTSGENVLNTHNTNNINRMILNNLEVFAEDLATLSGITLEFDKQHDLDIEQPQEGANDNV